MTPTQWIIALVCEYAALVALALFGLWVLYKHPTK